VIFSNRSVISCWAGGSAAGLAPQGVHQVLRARVGRALEGVVCSRAAQRRVDLGLAHAVAQQVHDQRALAVVDVGLVLDPDQRQLLHQFAAAGAQVAVQLVLQELADARLAVGLLHDDQGRVLGQGLGERGVALHVGADDLVGPPLVRQLVGGDVGG
jgi:hypothetical protein